MPVELATNWVSSNRRLAGHLIEAIDEPRALEDSANENRQPTRSWRFLHTSEKENVARSGLGVLDVFIAALRYLFIELFPLLVGQLLHCLASLLLGLGVENGSARVVDSSCV
jgi:hypothetical protein